ncbi:MULTISPECIES: hypothetical protein [unclassified Duganella]|uniref:hypothetical protein n=1 Tax=unclassified Duganella TaxID=2636909 RepID=UPI00111344AA|nr:MULTISPECIES: hypothetical protein [unclassified Duganella]
MALDINTAVVTRAGIPKELFGFNVPWSDFQSSYVNQEGVVREDLYPLLAPFAGAVYRYPGGNPTNNFEWKKTVGATAARTTMVSDFNNKTVPSFGLDEFGGFVKRLNSRAILTLNIYGKVATPSTADAASADAVGMLNYVRTTSPFKCVTGASCGVMAVELGNELDLAPINWSASTYVTRAGAVISAVNKTANLSGIEWVVSGRTAPWSGTDYNDFNDTLATGLSKVARGIAIHPYYDGIDIPYAMKFVNAFGKTWTTARSDGKVYVTEHARWPTVPKVGEWRDNWYMATSLGGAISSVDFLLALMGNNQVASSNWHALGNAGPWNLIRVSKLDNKLYPSPVYWGLRTAREAYLDNLVQVKYTVPKSTSGYSGGYDVKLVGMSATGGNSASVIGVNRGTEPYLVTINWSAGKRNAGTATLRTTTAASAATDNTDNAPNAVTMASSQKQLASRTSSSWCVPAQSVFSIVEP